MKSKVYHSKRPTWCAASEFNEDNYELVASVECGDMPEMQALNHSFKVTNSIDSYWGDAKDGVTVFATRCRSTSVGDILMYRGKTYAVARFGFNSI